MRSSTADNDLSEYDVGGGQFCGFGGVIHSGQMSFVVLPPMDEIPPGETSLYPTPVEIEHKTVMRVVAQ